MFVKNSKICQEKDSSLPTDEDEEAVGHSGLVCAVLRLCNDDEAVEKGGGKSLNEKKRHAAVDRLVSEFESYVVIQLDNSNFEDEIPSDINIISCYPNPFNPSTTIRFTLDSSNDFNIKIFNLSGQEVFTKNNIPSNLCLNEYTWNGMNYKGNSLTSGIYFITIEIDNRILMEKVTLLK